MGRKNLHVEWEAVTGLKVTASFVLAQSIESVVAVLAACDEKRYQAKRSGRNKVCSGHLPHCRNCFPPVPPLITATRRYRKNY